MPELPEVETLRRELEKALKGKTIKSANGNWPKMVKPLTLAEFGKQIKNKKIIAVKRRAKVLILDLSGPLSLLIHLKLTGQLIYQENKSAKGGSASGGKSRNQEIKKLNDNLPNKFTHLIFNFTDGSVLYFNDLRKFGWARLAGDAEVAKLISETGIEPLTKEFTVVNFVAVIKKYPNRKIKQILLDQKLISGLGNIYADESCFCAKILPTRQAKKIKPKDLKRLFNCITQVIKLAIAKKGTSADTYVQLDGKPGGMVPYLKVYGRKGEKCKRCGGVVSKIKLNGRGTHFCLSCQS